ncbi:MAG: peptidoglycan DD-metalloendopeptidase family protein [Oscillospiraceae bacterium]|nr:peptidoglycan DD-metalloendopeptidase family protein [Oscillospiraceae bacterium]
MKNRKRLVSIFAGVMAGIMLLSLILSLIPVPAHAASSSEIRKQINQLKKEKEELKDKIAEVQEQYEENENEIANIIAKKNIIDQEIQLLNTQITNIEDQLQAFNILIADKQDELDNAEGRFETLSEENKIRIRTMEEEGEVSYWEVVFKANSFSDLLDRLNIVEEIASSDKRRLKELSEAADAVELAQAELETEKADMELTKQELDETQAEMDAKRAEAEDLIQELLTKADDLEALEAEFEAQEEEFLNQIAQKEVEYDEAKQREWEAYMATYVPPTTAPPQQSTNNSGSGSTGNTGSSGNTGSTGNTNTGSSGGGGGGWIVPCSYTSITSPFGPRPSPTAGASSYHQGVDLDTGTGWPVVATRAGTVIFAGWGSAAGNYVTIDHHDGFRSIYMHLSSYSVSVGQNVSGGQYIGATGATGITTGDHLHFGISLNGVYVNPCNYVPL